MSCRICVSMNFDTDARNVVIDGNVTLMEDPGIRVLGWRVSQGVYAAPVMSLHCSGLRIATWHDKL